MKHIVTAYSRIRRLRFVANAEHSARKAGSRGTGKQKGIKLGWQRRSSPDLCGGGIFNKKCAGSVEPSLILFGV